MRDAKKKYLAEKKREMPKKEWDKCFLQKCISGKKLSCKKSKVALSLNELICIDSLDNYLLITS